MRKGKKQKYLSIINLILGLLENKKIIVDNDVILEIKSAIVALLKDMEEQGYLLKTSYKLERILSAIDELDGNESNYRDICSGVKTVKYDVENMMKNVTKQVVFMPYSASMWDTFESIYREIKTEEDVECLVMPIPYWGIDNNKEFTKYYYEKDLFPKDLELIDYRETELFELEADVIFIHNPYDQYNTLTRVFPEFYSSNLINYTDKLVYIPYYLSDEKTSLNQAYMPGVRNAWRVYVQSEEIKKQMLLAENEEEKIKVIGSPKIDEIVRKTVEKEPIPEAWEPKLAGKTVFCFITTIVSVLNCPDIFLDKVEWICDYFSNQKEIAVIWRPHPHTQKLLKGQRLQRYLSLCERYKKIGNGVLDEGVDNHLVLHLSDAYIGERSSMLTLYKVTGKPVYVMDWRSNELEVGNRFVSLATECVVNGNVWGVERRYNAVFEVDIKNNTARYVQKLEGVPLLGEWLFRHIVCYRDKVLFIDANARNSVLLNRVTKTQENLPVFRKENNHGVKNVNIIQEKNRVYIFPYFEEAIIEYDFETNHIIEIRVDYAMIKANIRADKPFSWSFGVKIGETFWLGSSKFNGVVCVNRDGLTKVYKLKMIKEGIVAGFAEKDSLYLLPTTEREVIQFNPKTHKEKRISVSEKLTDMMDDLIRMAKVQDNWIFVSKKSVILYNENANKRFIWSTKNVLFLNLFIWNDTVCLFSPYEDYFAKIDLNKFSFELNKIALDQNEQAVMQETFYAERREVGKEDYFYSEDITSLNDFIMSVVSGLLSNGEVIRKSKQDKWLGYIDGSCGKRIWEDVKNEVEK